MIIGSTTVYPSLATSVTHDPVVAGPREIHSLLTTSLLVVHLGNTVTSKNQREPIGQT